MNFKKNGKVFTSKSVGTGPTSYEKKIYRAAVSQRLKNTVLHHISRLGTPRKLPAKFLVSCKENETVS